MSQISFIRIIINLFLVVLGLEPQFTQVNTMISKSLNHSTCIFDSHSITIHALLRSLPSWWLDLPQILRHSSIINTKEELYYPMDWYLKIISPWILKAIFLLIIHFLFLSQSFDFKSFLLIWHNPPLIVFKLYSLAYIKYYPNWDPSSITF